MRVAVLGCGPAGLLAAHATALEGHEPLIFSRPVPSKIHGAQYIHEPIPEVTGPPSVISYAKLGDSGGYAEKVYGSPLAPSSWASFPQGEYPAWAMGAVYDALWERYESLIRPAEIDAAGVRAICELPDVDLVFCSVPLKYLCEKPEVHRFTHASVAFEPKCYVSMTNVVVYSGRKSEAWYRTSSLFSHDWTEYGESSSAVPEGWMTGIKPIETDCDCLDHPKLVKVGRFGKWEKKVLVTDAFKDAKEALNAL